MVLVTVVTGLFLAWLSNKLLVDEVVKRAMSRIYAPLLSLNYSDAGQRAITVVTVDDTDLNEYGLSWPVPLDFYQRLLDGVVKRKPSAIFLDVLFLDNKPEKEVQSLIRAACRAADAGIPFFMATFARELLSSDTERKIFAARTKFGVPCVTAARSNVTPDSLDQSQWAYPLRPRSEDEIEQSGVFPDSVALSIYCRLYATTCPSKTEVPLSLIWASKAEPTNVSTMVARDKQGTLMTVCRGHWNWWEVLPGANMLFQLAGNPILPLCPYNEVIPVRAFKGYGFSAAQLDEAVKGKVVMIGADLKAIGDNSFSPLHGRLPGIHVHAMALDNLISFDGRYRENGDFEWRHLWHAPANLFIFLSILLTASVMVFWKHHKEGISSQHLAAEMTNRGGFGEWPIVQWLRSTGAQHSENPVVNSLVRLGLFLVKWSVRLSLLVTMPLLLVLGWPRFGSTQKTRHELKLALWGLMVYLALGVVIFYLGYYVFYQGPLSIIEYVLFPLMAHFLHVGETIASRSRQFWLSLWASNPWAEWAAQGIEAETKAGRH